MAQPRWSSPGALAACQGATLLQEFIQRVYRSLLPSGQDQRFCSWESLNQKCIIGNVGIVICRHPCCSKFSKKIQQNAMIHSLLFCGFNLGQPQKRFLPCRKEELVFGLTHRSTHQFPMGHIISNSFQSCLQRAF